MAAQSLVIGGSGRLGRLIVAQLSAAGDAPRVLSRTPESAEQVLGSAVEVRAIDDPHGFDGIDRLVLLTPIAADLAATQIALIDRARAAGVRRIVKISGSDWTITSGRSRAGRLHAEVETHLQRSRLEQVALRPNAWMQVSLPPLLALARAGQPLPIREGNPAVSYIDAHDIAAVAVQQLHAPKPAEGPLVLTGRAALTIADVATALEQSLGRAVAVAPAASQAPLPPHRDPFESAAIAEFMVLIGAGLAAPVTSTVTALLNRPPRSVADFLDGLAPAA